MQKQVTRTVTETKGFCDICGDQSHHSGLDYMCSACRRECCYKCITGFFYAKSGQLLDFSMKLCKKCQKHHLLIEKMQAELDGANKKIREWYELLCAAGRAEKAESMKE